MRRDGGRRSFEYVMPSDGQKIPQEFNMPFFLAGWYPFGCAQEEAMAKDHVKRKFRMSKTVKPILHEWQNGLV